ncbi:hypothetical protein [Marinobacter orientalis]|uniref:Toxin CptA n=1 Tax=Marinobacter orientalis TaxID=1928859 RepID=A0A7Y0RDD3_9GAMM|nr:hypothetical protein [Marinobacter orientalis]NMT64153.1 hypothetical protein [Marinobacter orientalis]TGX49381.1 hypothetical protein DIT72_11165 [Marinobacter orientalis]
MSSRIDLRISPSHPVAFLCALPWLLLTALVALIASDHGLVLVTLVAVTLCGAIFQYRRGGLLAGPDAVVGLRIENRHLYARLRSGADVAVVPADESRMSARFAILKLRCNGSIYRRYPVVLVAFSPGLSNTSPEAFRQLRVWLRLGPGPRASEAGDQQPSNVQEIH